MIREVRSKVSKAPENNYTEAACDDCKAVCPESRLPGRKGIGAANEADGLAVKHGWTHRYVQEKKSPKSRKFTTYVRLVCPTCQAVAAEGEVE